MEENGKKRMEEPVRVLNYCEKWQPGGIQKIQALLAEELQGKPYQMDVYVSEQNTEAFVDSIRKTGAGFFVTLSQQYSSPVRRMLANMRALSKILAEKHYDIVHFNICQGVELVYLWEAKRAGISIRIAHCRNNGLGAGGKSRYIKLMAHNLCKHLFQFCPTIRLANSEMAAGWMYPKKWMEKGAVQILDNGIDTERFRFDPKIREQVRNEYQLNGRFVIGHVGHFSYQKNHEFVIRIFYEYQKKHPDAFLLLVGVGKLQESIRKMACDLKIENSICFAGETELPERFMFAMDLFLFPSRFEGFGNVLVEAQTAGLPCLASADVIPEKVKMTDEYIALSLDCSVEEWIEKLEELRQKRKSRTDHVRETCAHGFDIQRMIFDVRQIYADALKNSLGNERGGIRKEEMV